MARAARPRPCRLCGAHHRVAQPGECADHQRPHQDQPPLTGRGLHERRHAGDDHGDGHQQREEQAADVAQRLRSLVLELLLLHRGDPFEDLQACRTSARWPTRTIRATRRRPGRPRSPVSTCAASRRVGRRSPPARQLREVLLRLPRLRRQSGAGTHVRPPQVGVEVRRSGATGSAQRLVESVGGVLHDDPQGVVERSLLVGREHAVARPRQPADGPHVQPTHRLRREDVRQIGACQWPAAGRGRGRHAAHHAATEPCPSTMATPEIWRWGQRERTTAWSMVAGRVVVARHRWRGLLQSTRPRCSSSGGMLVMGSAGRSQHRHLDRRAAQNRRCGAASSS